MQRDRIVIAKYQFEHVVMGTTAEELWLKPSTETHLFFSEIITEASGNAICLGVFEHPQEPDHQLNSAPLSQHREIKNNNINHNLMDFNGVHSGSVNSNNFRALSDLYIRSCLLK